MGSVGTAVVVERDDDALVADVRSGDDRAFEELYTRYRRRIAAYVLGMVSDHGRAEDITQEVFISALRRMRETERSIAFKPWIYEIAKNACIDAYRRSKRAEEVSLDGDSLAPADYGRLTGTGPSPESAVEGKQRLGDLCSAFGGLSQAHHEILVLRELEGLSYREIGERMGLSRPSVESTLFRARRRLTEEYDDLASGRRCGRIQAMIESGTALGIRDRRRMARHLSHCQPCRRHARLHGLETGELHRGFATRVAAFLPLPFLLRRFRPGGGDVAASAGGHTSGQLAQVAANLAPSADAVGGWSKAAIVAASLAVAGAGAGVATQATSSSVRHHHAPPSRVVTPPRHTSPGAHRSAAPASSKHKRATARGARGHLKRAAARPASHGVSGTTHTGTVTGAGAVPQKTTSSSSSSSGSGGSSGSASHQSGGGGSSSKAKVSVPDLTNSVHVKLPDSATQVLEDPVGTTTQDVQKTVSGLTQTVDSVLNGVGVGG
jgi:RNA polymerase sigma factor (sigma-70 family)